MATTTSGGTIVMVGTRKGLWIGRSDEAREEWEFTGPHFDMEEVYSCMVDTRGDTPRLLVGRELELARSPGRALRRPRRVAGRRRPTGRSASLRAARRPWPGSGSWCPVPRTASSTPAPSRARSGGPTDRGETFALEQALWDHPERPEWGEGFGGQAFHTILPHPTDPLSVTAAISTGGVYQTTDGGRVLAGAQPGHQGGVPAGGRAVPRLRPVRAQGHPASVAARAALPAEPRRRLPLRRRGRSVEVHRRRPARRVRLPDRRAPPRARHRLRVPAQRRCRPLPTRGQGAGVALPRRGGDLGGARNGCPRPSTSA